MNLCSVCVNLGTLKQHKLFKTPGHQHVSNVRGMILITTTMVSIDFHIYHATRALSVSGANGMPQLAGSNVKSEASQADKAYFGLALSFHSCLQQLSRAMS